MVFYTTRSGDCGSVGERIVNFDQTAQPIDAGADAGPPQCSGPVTMTADNCEVDYSTKCRIDGDPKVSATQVTGNSKWNVAGTYGTAVEQWSILDKAGNPLCTGTYGVTLHRQ